LPNLRRVVGSASFGRKPESARGRHSSGGMVTGHEKKTDAGIVEGPHGVGRC
jgi:hypothetical protein